MPGPKNGYDGSITINTELNNEGFQRGSQDLKKAVRSLSREVSETGSRLNKAFRFDFGQPRQAVNSFSKAVRQANTDISALGDLAKQAIKGDADALSQFQVDSESVSGRLEAMRAELEKFGDARFETPEHAKAAAEYEKAAASVRDLSAALTEAEDSFDTLTDEFTTSREFQDLEDRIEVLKMYKEAYDAAAARGDKRGEAMAMMDSGVGKGSIADAIKAAEAEMDKMWIKFQNSGAYKGAEAKIAKLEQALKDASAEAERCKASLESVPESFSGRETESYERDSAALDALAEKMAAYRQRVAEAMDAPDKAAIKAALDETKEKIKAADAAAAALRNSFRRAFAAIASGARKAAARLAGMVKSGVAKGLSKIGAAISDIGKHSKKSNKNLGTSFKTILKYGLGIRSLYVLFNKLRSAILSGFEAIRGYDKDFDEMVFSLKLNLKYLQNSFAAAVKPIAETVIPVLNSFIETITRVLSKVGQLAAALTGKSSFLEATKAQDAYAQAAQYAAENAGETVDSILDEGKAAKKTAKEIKRSLAGFDDVEILHEDKDSDSDSSKPSVLGFTESPIGDDMKGLADLLKDAWANADFTKIGRMIGDKILEGLNSIPWDRIKALAEKTGKSLATLLNGILETPGLFSKIGETLAEALNTAFTFLESFIRNFHWDSLGKAIKDGILGFLSNIDWDLIYKTMRELGEGIGTAIENAFNNPEIWTAIFTALSNRIRALVIFLRSLLGAIRWQELGENIGIGLRAGMESIPWDEIYGLAGDFGKDLALFLNGLISPETFADLGETVANALNAALEFLDTFGQTFSWTNFGNSLAAGVNAFMATFDTSKLDSGIRTFVLGIKDAIVTTIRGINWHQFGEGLRDVIIGLPWKELIEGFGEVFWEAVNAAIETAKGIFDGDEAMKPLIDALTELQETVSSISEKIDFDALAAGVGALVKALEPAAAGFGAGLISVFDGLLKIGIEFISSLGPAFQGIADALNSLPEGSLESFGEGLGKVAGALIVMKGATSVLTVLGGFAAKLASLGAAGSAAGAGATQAAEGMSAAAGTAEAAASGGIGTFLSALGQSAGITATFGQLIQDHVIAWLDGSKEAALEADEAFGYVKGALYDAGIEGDVLATKLSGVMSPMDHLSDSDVPAFKDAFAEVAQRFEEAGGNVGTFKDNLSAMLSDGVFNASQAEVIQDYIESIGGSAETAESQTGGLAGAFEQFESLSWTVPLKMALLTAAVQAIGDSGKLSKEDTDKLYQVLDDYNASGTEKEMGKVQKAFEDTGISAEEFVRALSISMSKMDPKTQAEIQKVLKTVKNSGSDLKKEGKDSFALLGEGAVQGLESKEKDIRNKSSDIIVKDVLGTMDDRAEMHSPSRQTHNRGKNLMQGLIDGMAENQKNAAATVQGIMDAVLREIDARNNDMRSAGQKLTQMLSDGIREKQNDAVSAARAVMDAVIAQIGALGSDLWRAGQNAMTEFNNGLSNGGQAAAATASGIADGVKWAFANQDWGGVGYNIGMGIYNGLASSGGALNVLANNVAINMFNTAKAALGIASPSKVFAWIGRMVGEGLSGGVEATQGSAVKSVAQMADAIVEEAEQAGPVMQIDTALTGLDGVLSDFSSRMVDGFASMIEAMEAIASGAALPVPAMAAGYVAPYATRKAAAQDDADGSSAPSGTVPQDGLGSMTKDELAEMLATALTRYASIEFFIGDEQIARHANAGNVRLGRRYSATAV